MPTKKPSRVSGSGDVSYRATGCRSFKQFDRSSTRVATKEFLLNLEAMPIHGSLRRSSVSRKGSTHPHRLACRQLLLLWSPQHCGTPQRQQGRWCQSGCLLSRNCPCRRPCLRVQPGRSHHHAQQLILACPELLDPLLKSRDIPRHPLHQLRLVDQLDRRGNTVRPVIVRRGPIQGRRLQAGIRGRALIRRSVLPIRRPVRQQIDHGLRRRPGDHRPDRLIARPLPDEHAAKDAGHQQQSNDAAEQPAAERGPKRHGVRVGRMPRCQLFKPLFDAGDDLSSPSVGNRIETLCTWPRSRPLPDRRLAVFALTAWALLVRSNAADGELLGL